MKAIVSVIGKDRKGIIAKISTILAAHNINVEDISQTLLQEYFTMIMLVDISQSTLKIGELKELLKAEGEKIGMSINIQHQEIFDVMHKIW